VSEPSITDSEMRAVFLTLGGGVLEFESLRRNIGADSRMIAELALLWEFDLGRAPDASAFDPGFVEYADVE
jgi:hypothetical protein